MDGICIYGRGVKGLEAFFCLRDCGIDVEYVIDTDQKKQGEVLPGLNCISYKEFLTIGSRTSKVIISNKKSREIMVSLKKDGFEDIELWTECKKRYNRNLMILDDFGLLNHYLNIIKQFNTCDIVEEVPYIHNLIRDMKFRNGLRGQDESY